MKTWNIDNTHSEIGFKVKHLMISNVRGKFNNFEGKIELPDEDLTTGVISFSAETNSIDTGNTMRDGHLQSPEFFDSALFPTLTFASKSVTNKSGNDFEVVGTLTMHGVAKEITLNTTYNGMTSGMDGLEVMSFEITGSLSRKDFGLTWNAPIEQGGVVVSDEIKLDINAEFKEIK